MGKFQSPIPFESMVVYTMRSNVQNDGRAILNSSIRDFPGGPVVKTMCSQCRGPGFNP